MKGVAFHHRWRYALLASIVVFAGYLLMLQPKWILNRLMHRSPGVLYAVDTDQKLIALTIDDGPDSHSTNIILDVLAQNEAHATFFVLVDRVVENEDVVERMVAEGHELGNHLLQDTPSIQHPNYEFESQLEHAHKSLSRFTEIRWFRPGSGWYNRDMLRSLEPYKYRLALGSIYPFDSHIPSSWFASRYIVWRANPGAIIVLHDYGNRGQRTIATLSYALPILKQRGYRIVTLSEMIQTTAPEAN